MPSLSEPQTNPDPENKISQDDGQLIRFESTAVPSFVEAGGRTRIHLRMIPAAGKWNNESEPLRVWVESDGNTVTSGSLLQLDNPNSPESKEPRHLEFEVQISGSAKSCVVKGYALYNACHEDDSTCRFLRQDFTVEVSVR